MFESDSNPTFEPHNIDTLQEIKMNCMDNKVVENRTFYHALR